MTITSKYTKTFSRVSGVDLAIRFTPSLEVTIEYTEKEIYEVTLEPKYDGIFSKFPQKETRERILKRWEKVEPYPMRQVSAQELLNLRLSKVPGVVYKKDNKLFYTAVPGDLSMAGKADALGKHACGDKCTMVCNGCPKTRDLTVTYQQRIHKNIRFYTAVINSWRIEKYDFILEGLEAFNMESQNDMFIVLKCENYKVRSKEANQPRDISALKLGLASFAWEDFNGDRREMLDRIQKNCARNDRI